MGVSTDGQICFGVAFEEGFDFPWRRHNEEAWWRAVNGYQPPFKLYDKRGEYIDGVRPSEERLEEYYRHQNAWDDEHPLPFELVNACSGDCPQWILAVPGTFLRVRRGYPEQFDPTSLVVPAKELELLLAFLENYNMPGEPHWYLSSFWG